jgi:hypothetical protein
VSNDDDAVFALQPAHQFLDRPDFSGFVAINGVSEVPKSIVLLCIC